MSVLMNIELDKLGRFGMVNHILAMKERFTVDEMIKAAESYKVSAEETKGYIEELLDNGLLQEDGRYLYVIKK